MGKAPKLNDDEAKAKLADIQTEFRKIRSKVSMKWENGKPEFFGPERAVAKFRQLATEAGQVMLDLDLAAAVPVDVETSLRSTDDPVIRWLLFVSWRVMYQRAKAAENN